MKLKKGSAAAKAYMAKIRAKRKTVKSEKGNWSLADRKQLAKELGEDFYSAEDWKKLTGKTKRKVGAIAKTKTGKPKKRLSKAEREYNKDVDAYKYFVIKDGKIQSGYEFKSDALDAANDYEPKAVVLSIPVFKKLGIYNEVKEFMNKHKYTLGATKKVGSTLKLKPNEKRLGATPKDVKGKGYHKDTKSHNVNIRVISGVEDTKGVRDLMEKDIFYTVETLNRIVDNLPNLTNKAEIARHKLQIRAFKKMVEDKKKQLRALNKLINSNLK